MRIFVHYRIILNILLEFGPRQPARQMNRIWKFFLESDSLELFVSDRGMRRICQELDIYVHSLQSAEIKYELERIFRICPPEDLQEVRNFTHMCGGNSYEEGIEIHSAFRISADAILTVFPQDFKTFSLVEIPLNEHVDIDSIKSARVSSRLPPLLIGNLSDLQHIQRAKLSGTPSFPSNLARWFRENRFEKGWQPVEELAIPYRQTAYRKKNVRRGKLLSIAPGDSSEAWEVALVVTVSNPLHESNVVVEILPAGHSRKLPSLLSLQVLDSNQKCVEQEVAAGKQSVALAIDGEEAEVFSLLICYQNFVHQEKFII